LAFGYRFHICLRKEEEIEPNQEALNVKSLGIDPSFHVVAHQRVLRDRPLLNDFSFNASARRYIQE
jgi:hypothetical protein